MCSIKDIRNRLGITQREFSEYFEIPIKTIQQWERCGAKPASYIPKMMERILDLEDRLNGKEA